MAGKNTHAHMHICIFGSKSKKTLLLQILELNCFEQVSYLNQFKFA